MPVKQESELKDQLKQALTQQVMAIRDRRRLVEEKWLRSRRVWMNFTDGNVSPSDTGVGKYNIPTARRAIERTCVRAVKRITPSVKWFEISPMGDNVDQMALTNTDNFMWYVLRKRIRSRSNISQLTRCLLLYSMPVLKTSIAIKNKQVWPTQRAVDPFAFYMYPETSPTIEEAEVVFEDFLFSYERYKTFADIGIVDDLPQSAFSKPDWPYHLVERLAYQGITDPSANVDVVINKVEDQLQKTTATFVSLTEMWITREDKLYQVYIAWNLKNSGPKIVGFFQSRYDQPMYRTAFHRPLPGESYTNAQMEDITELDGIQNDMFNLFIGAVDWEQGFVAFNEQSNRKDSFKMKGRAKWEMSDDPRQVLQFIQPPITSTNILRAWQVTQGIIQSMGGAGTIAEGQPGRNMPRAGGAVSDLITLGLADVTDIAEIIEQEVLTPGLSDIYKVASFIPDDQLMRIPGGQALYHGSDARSNIIKKENIRGDYEFEWVGSIQFQDEAERAQRGMIFLNMMPQLAPFLQQQGYQFNVVEMLQFVWRYMLGERGLTKIIIPIQQQGGGAVGGNGITPPAGSNGSQNGAPSTSTPPPTNGIPGLNPSPPTVTQGFVRR